MYKVVGQSCGKGAKGMVREIWITLAIGVGLECCVASQVFQDDERQPASAYLVHSRQIVKIMLHRNTRRWVSIICLVHLLLSIAMVHIKDAR